MKRSPLKRKTPMRSRKVLGVAVRRGSSVKIDRDAFGAPIRIRKKRPKKRSKYATRKRAPESWWIFVKQMCGCSVPAAGAIAQFQELIRYTPCDFITEADHDRADGLGRKSKDRDVWAICKQHHTERTDHTGAFKAFTKADMRAFRAWAIARTHRLAKLAGVEIPSC